MNRLILIFCLCLSVLSQADDCPSSTPVLSVYYGNGMFNDYRDAEESGELLQILTYNQLNGYEINYNLSINNNENPFDQLLEVARQKLLQDYGVILLWLAGIEIAPDWFQDALSEVAIQYQAFSYVIDRDLQQHVKQYKEDIEACQKVLLVAHSQGNFYGNEAWRWVYRSIIGKLPLNQLKVMGMVSVATPASHIGEPLAYDGDQQQITRYMTLNNDLVINTIRSAILGPMPGNFNNNSDSDDWKNHSFIDAYATGTPSEQILINHIQSVAYNLESLPLEREPLNSSALAAVAYDRTANILEVEFASDGSVYRYYEVPESIYSNLVNAESVGRYYNQAIRGQYPSRNLF